MLRNDRLNMLEESDDQIGYLTPDNDLYTCEEGPLKESIILKGRELILSRYKGIKDSLASVIEVTDEDSFDKFLDEKEIELSVIDEVDERFVHTKEVKALKKKREILRRLQTLSPEERARLTEDLHYLQSNLPDLADYSNLLTAGIATGMAALNFLGSHICRGALSAGLPYLAAQEQDPVKKALLVIASGWVWVTNAPIPIPSIPGIVKYLQFVGHEEILIRIYKTLKSPDKLAAFKENLHFNKDNFFSPARLSLTIEGVGGLLMLTPMEFLRAFDLENISPKSLRLWRDISMLKGLENEK